MTDDYQRLFELATRLAVLGKEPPEIYTRLRGVNQKLALEALRDMMGRANLGVRFLTDDHVRLIRADTRSERAIAADYGVNSATINRIKNLKTYRHVDGPAALIGNKKVTHDQVRAIRKDGRVYSIIAKQYGISPQLVSQIKHRKRYRHVN